MQTAVEQTLKQYFHFDSLRPGQTDVITHIMQGHSAAAIFPTGSGKSLCYQLPALMLPHLTLVISPLLALIKDQVDFLHSKGITAASIDSNQTKEETQLTMQRIRSGEIKILMISVERLKNERFRQFISQIPISMMVVDEAHCISEWGHNFRPDYLKLPQYRHELSIPQVLLLTATATTAVIDDMQRKFAIQREHVTTTGFYRPNLTLDIEACPTEEKLERLLARIRPAPEAPTIVYVTLQKTAEWVAEHLIEAGVSAVAYHAGLKSEQREAIQQAFMTGQQNCIVATIAFGMGIDKANIRRVIHFDLPKSIENYSQEIGRAGRDGLQSECITLANKENVNVLENFVYGDTPDLSAIEYVIREIYASGERWEVMLNRLSQESTIRQLPLKTLLVYLELHHVIESKFSYYASYRFKYLAAEQEIIQRFPGEKRAFIEAILRCSVKAKTWNTVDFDAIWHSYHGSRERVVLALDYLNEKGLIELESKQITDVYQVLDTTKPAAELAQQLYQLFEHKENSEIGRIQTMLDFFQSDHCLSHFLADYFADNNAPEKCGHCSVCMGKTAVMPKTELPAIDSKQLSLWVAGFVDTVGDAASVKAIARFLCGIPNPLSTKTKANKLPGFGQMERYPFADIIDAVEQVK
ncbi:RecQ family ATP-dependent DNA helicase [Vibrio sp.]|nr:RecQ family ATP-dependent DNA helicase [Vibrio sp.]